MDPLTVGIVVTAGMIVLLMLRIPIAVSLVMAGYIGMVLVVAARGAGGFDLEAGLIAANTFMGQLPFTSAASYTLSTIPMFMLMGYFATEGGFTRDIYSTARIWLGRVPGGLAVASACGCAMFAAISGSSLATAAAMGRMAVPEMLKRGYQKALATGVVAGSGTLGSLIPPSILMIIYAVFTEQSIAALFIAGVIPGILTLVVYMAIIMGRSILNPSLAPPIEKTTMREKVASLKNTWGMLALILLVLVGLYTGFFSPNEAGAFGAAAAFFLCVFSRRLDRKGTASALRETVRTTSMLFAAIIGAYMVTSFTALTGIAAELTAWAGGFDGHPLLVLASLSVLYIMLGTFMGSIEIMLLTLPIVIPIVEGLDYNLIWWGIIMIKYLEIGMVSPPIGINCFIIKAVVGDEVSLGDIFRGVSWFILGDVIVIALLVIWPGLVLWLPEMITAAG